MHISYINRSKSAPQAPKILGFWGIYKNPPPYWVPNFNKGGVLIINRSDTVPCDSTSVPQSLMFFLFRLFWTSNNMFGFGKYTISCLEHQRESCCALFSQKVEAGTFTLRENLKIGVWELTDDLASPKRVGLRSESDLRWMHNIDLAVAQ